MSRRFEDLSTREVLALAIVVEKNNTERFATLADMFLDQNDEVHRLFSELGAEEREHMAQLEEAWAQHFGGESMPAIDETEISELVEAVDLEHGEHGLFDDIREEDALALVHRTEKQAHEFYVRAARTGKNAELIALYEELAAYEKNHMTAVADPAAWSASKGKGQS